MPVYALANQEPDLHPQSWVAPTAVVVGDVHLGEHASVWFGAVVRADNAPIRIGARSNVQENAVLHVDPGFALEIGADVTIGHQAMLHGCTIGDGSLIGIQAIVLNGARIGKGCLIGAGALITEGKEIPDHSLVMGSPGKVVRTLGPEQLERLKMSAQSYAQRSSRFASSLAQR